MFARTSDKGEPAKINFCKLRTDSIENSLDSPFAGAADENSAVDCTVLSMNRPSLQVRFGNSILGANRFRSSGRHTGEIPPENVASDVFQKVWNSNCCFRKYEK
jgi:hypothetical protein